MITLGYIFTLLHYISYCASRFMKQKTLMLLLELCANIFLALGLYYLNSLSGYYIVITLIFVLITANIKERLHKKWILGHIFFQTVYATILYTTYVGLSSVLIFTSASIALVNVWWMPPQKMRLISALTSTIFLIYQLSIQNWAGLIELIVITCNFLAFFKYKKQIPASPQKELS